MMESLGIECAAELEEAGYPRNDTDPFAPRTRSVIRHDRPSGSASSILK